MAVSSVVMMLVVAVLAVIRRILARTRPVMRHRLRERVEVRMASGVLPRVPVRMMPIKGLRVHGWRWLVPPRAVAVRTVRLLLLLLLRILLQLITRWLIKGDDAA